MYLSKKSFLTLLFLLMIISFNIYFMDFPFISNNFYPTITMDFLPEDPNILDYYPTVIDVSSLNNTNMMNTVSGLDDKNNLNFYISCCMGAFFLGMLIAAVHS